MSREEEIRKAKGIFYASSDDYTFHTKGFEEGAKWADKHPRKGLWDSKKVIEWLALHCELYGGFNPNKLNQMCENLIKSMEE